MQNKTVKEQIIKQYIMSAEKSIYQDQKDIMDSSSLQQEFLPDSLYSILRVERDSDNTYYNISFKTSYTPFNSFIPLRQITGAIFPEFIEKDENTSFIYKKSDKKIPGWLMEVTTLKLTKEYSKEYFTDEILKCFFNSDYYNYKELYILKEQNIDILCHHDLFSNVIPVKYHIHLDEFNGCSYSIDCLATFEKSYTRSDKYIHDYYLNGKRHFAQYSYKKPFKDINLKYENELFAVRSGSINIDSGYEPVEMPISIKSFSFSQQKPTDITLELYIDLNNKTFNLVKNLEVLENIEIIFTENSSNTYLHKYVFPFVICNDIKVDNYCCLYLKASEFWLEGMYEQVAKGLFYRTIAPYHDL